MSTFKDITGQKYNLLTVEKFSCIRNNKSYWICRCDCGTTKELPAYHFKYGNTKSCGCLSVLSKRTRAIERNTKHSGRKLPEYEIWHGIKARCHNNNSASFKHYGGRGIIVCEEWRNSFEAFYRDIGPRPSSKHSIDRIDNSGNYCHLNCRWATATEQARNRRATRNNITGQCGVRFNKRSKKWTAEIKVDKRVFLGYFCSAEEAVSARKAAEIKYWGRSET
jgi:hypothetical protein